MFMGGQMFLVTVGMLLAVILQVSGRCPESCRCERQRGRKTVICDKGGMTKIPTNTMDTDTQIIVVSASPNNPNFLTIGRIFLDFTVLEEVYIMHSYVPAIGHSSFWPGTNLRVLNLGHNNISQLHDFDFNGLTNLEVLDLSDNVISATPSAPFRFLSNLTTLSLARNKLTRLVPRIFYMLKKLERLDLSSNPLGDIDPENLKDLRPLKSLSLANCRLSRLHSLIYQHLPNLEELDLRDNFFNYFAPEEFRHLKKLRMLYLDGNEMSVIVDKAFNGHYFDYLGLSRNQIVSLDSCAFCNASIKSLNISRNQFASLKSNILKEVTFSLQALDIGFNNVAVNTVASVIQPLHRLRRLSLSGLALTTLPPQIFLTNRDLRVLDLSQNELSTLDPEILRPLSKLEELNLSGNLFLGLQPQLLDQFTNMTRLSNVLLHSNPWTCELCHILPTLRWLNRSLGNRKVCRRDQSCFTCVHPERLAFREVRSLRVSEVPPCGGPKSQFRIFNSGSQIGIIIAVTFLVILLLVAIIVILIYKRQGAVYYTHEEERNDNYFYDTTLVGDINGGHKDEKSLRFIATLDKIEETRDDYTSKSKNRIT
ncbi:uncharacterized protein LOC143251008 [Tachypleus tridentatus]|uniref:uncharacterized protein LOC143251008 n=1 Tax=Tachypleus tridentatus TaxID=6853 RepID=UPI003FD523BA